MISNVLVIRIKTAHFISHNKCQVMHNVYVMRDGVRVMSLSSAKVS